MRRTAAVCAVVAGLLLAGCGGSPHRGATGTTTQPTTAPTTSPPTTPAAPTTTAPNPDVVPAKITPAYINAVFAVLNHVYGNAARLMIATRQISAQVVADLRAIFADPLFKTELKIFTTQVKQGFQGVRHPPGDRITSVKKILIASSSCVYIQTSTNYTPVVYHASPESGSEYYGLEDKPSSIDPHHRNPTSWVIFSNTSYKTVTAPPTDPCTAK